MKLNIKGLRIIFPQNQEVEEFTNGELFEWLLYNWHYGAPNAHVSISISNPLVDVSFSDCTITYEEITIISEYGVRLDERGGGDEE